MKLSHSQISLAKSCWMKYKWKYEDKLNPVSKPVYYTIGSVIHEAFDSLAKGESDESCLNQIIKSFDNEISKSELSDQEALLIAKYNAIAIWKYNPFKTNTFKIVANEFEFDVKVKGLKDVTLSGRIDGVVLDNGVHWCREFKTTGLSHEQFNARIQNSYQGTGYVYALNKLGYKVNGIMYDMIKKQYLRKKQDENADQFGKRIILDYQMRPDYYFKRMMTYRNPDHIDLFIEDIKGFVRDLRAKKKSGKFYRNPDNCFQFNSECPYRKICFSKDVEDLTLSLMFRRGDDKADIQTDGV